MHFSRSYMAGSGMLGRSSLTLLLRRFHQTTPLDGQCPIRFRLGRSISTRRPVRSRRSNKW